MIRQPQHARLQAAMLAWIKSDGGPFGEALQSRSAIDGDYVMTDGEMASMMAVDAMLRFDKLAEAFGIPTEVERD